ncbi:triose-phosphate isomerase [Candidatus Nomurabacteria bacterium]|nr:triose-phosphate isomerase [Candidatus Nomurabacteria bacterium]
MSKNKIIIGNWKMNPSTQKEAEKLFVDITKSIFGVQKTEIVICPPFLYLEKLRSASRRTKKISLGAQNVFYEEAGPYTGEISASMLEDLGIKYVIVGHSKRRELGETGLDINKKIKASLSAGLVPILCVGETVRDESHSYFNLVKTQLEECLDGVKKDLISKIIIAYEPIWAISSTPNHKDATPADCEEMSLFIKKILVDKFGVKIKIPRIIYGGDVNEKNVQDFLKDGGVEGVLVGRVSLDAVKFMEIIKICEALSQ